MAEVAFHFNVPERTAYTCRLLRKVWRSGQRAHVAVDAAALHALDMALWTFAAEEFLPHATHHAPAHVLTRSPVVLADESVAAPTGTIWVNLLPHVPEAWLAAPPGQRIIEVVTQDETDRQGARQRWRLYAGQGHQLVRHDLAAAQPT
ncbi:DNA polymerase III subunit chi [Hydrogenophaga defluvii]|uniref:DNA polymerase III subunit chi n=1 Tax=Hydrogenophaga defluvii TaxID=249410 RepID=A0ABW2SF35_9BURK